MKTTKTKPPMWVVMIVSGWDLLTINGIQTTPPKEGPHAVLPLFNTREQAVAWNGSEDNVHELELKTK